MRRRSTGAVPGDRLPHRELRRRGERLRATVPLTTYLFDVLHRDGVDLIDEPALASRVASTSSAPHLLVPRVTTTSRTPLRSSTSSSPPGTRASSSRPRRARTPRAGGGAGGSRSSPRTPSTSSCSPSSGVPGGAGFLSNIHLGARDPSDGVRHGGQDLQGDDRRDAALADRALHRGSPSTAPRGGSSAAAGAGRRGRLRRVADLRAIRAVSRCGSPASCATATTSRPTRPTPSPRCGRSPRRLTRLPARRGAAQSGGVSARSRAAPATMPTTLPAMPTAAPSGDEVHVDQVSAKSMGNTCHIRMRAAGPTLVVTTSPTARTQGGSWTTRGAFARTPTTIETLTSHEHGGGVVGQEGQRLPAGHNGPARGGRR